MITAAIREQNARFEAVHSLRARGISPPPGYQPMAEEEARLSVADRIRQMGERYPARPAFYTDEEVLTYAELNRRANQVAWSIHAAQPEATAPIGLCFASTRPPMATGHVGALKTGRPYVALDPGFPRDRLLYALRHSGASLILTDASSSELAHDLAREGGALVIDTEDPAEPFPDTDFRVEIGPNNPFYIVYTSGSTGEPKGVWWPNRSRMVATWCFNRYFYGSSEDRFSMLHSYGFNSSSPEFWGGLLEGACVCPYDFRRQGVQGLATFLQDRRITVFHWIPSAFRAFAAELPPDLKFPSLRLLFLMGEPVTEREAAIYHQRCIPPCLLCNRYGTTETGLTTQFLVDVHTRLEGPAVPSGYTLPGRSVRIVGPDGEPLPPGQEGEIVIQSALTSGGYWRDPELTAACFTPVAGSDEWVFATGDRGRLRPDGCLEHLGRLDAQVKVRGHRVEVAEVEAALRRLPQVADALVLPRQVAEEVALTAYVVATGGVSLTIPELRGALAAQLPGGFIPDRYVLLPELPRTATGKVNPSALPDPGDSRPDLPQPYAAPETPLEERIATLWSEVLHVSPVGRHDPFLDLGGNSLRAAQIAVRLSQECGVSLTPIDLFAQPTVAQLASRVLAMFLELTASKEVEGLLSRLPDPEAHSVAVPPDATNGETPFRSAHPLPPTNENASVAEIAGLLGDLDITRGRDA